MRESAHLRAGSPAASFSGEAHVASDSRREIAAVFNVFNELRKKCNRPSVSMAAPESRGRCGTALVAQTLLSVCFYVADHGS